LANFKRKQYIINKSLQYSLIGRVFSTVVIAVALLAVFTFIFNHRSLQKPQTKLNESIEIVRNSLKSLSPLAASQKDINKFSLLQRATRMGREVSDALQDTEEAFREMESNMWKTFLMVVTISAVFVFFVFLFISHRIAGPVFRLEKTLQALTEGKLTVKAYLRKKDYLKSLAAGLNEMSESYRQKIGAMQQTFTKLEEKIAQQNGNEELQQHLQELKSRLDSFKVS